MYQFLRGELVEKSATSLVLDVGGVGYHLQVPLSTHAALPPLGQTITLLTHFVVREDAHLLFGFWTEDERTLFRLLLSVSGIGPKLAMTVLSGFPLRELKYSIVEGEVDKLKSISGIGKKTAERIVIELREKVVLEGQRGKELSSMVTGGASQSLVEDSLEALIALGYSKQNAKGAIEKVIKQSDKKQDSWTVEELIRTSLKYV